MDDGLVEIKTPEKIVFKYTLARTGTRIAAWVIDGVVQIFTFLIMFLLVLNFTVFTPLKGSEGFYYSVAFFHIIFFFYQWGYYIFFETLLNGQTPGKKITGIAVIETGGVSLKFSTIFLRNLLRVVDSFPFCYLTGGLISIRDAYNRRLGDIIAGTYVIEVITKALQEPSHAVFFSSTSHEKDSQKDHPELNAQLNEEELWVLRKFLNEKNRLPGDKKIEVAWVLANKLKQRVNMSERIFDPIEFIEKVYKANT